MQSEFEKQVQQKMEELNLVPSSPVWLNIEKQIRKEKKRRRAIFWIPLGIVLLTGVLTWFWNSDKNLHGKQEPVSITKYNQEGAVKEVRKAGNPETDFQNQDFNRGNKSQPINSQPGFSIPLETNDEHLNETVKTKIDPDLTVNRPVQRSQQALNPFSRQEAELPGRTALEKNPATPVKTSSETTEQNNISVVEKKSTTVPGNEIISAVEKKSLLQLNTVTPDTLKRKDSIVKLVVVTEKPAVHSEIKISATNSWKLGVATAVGFSGEGNRIRLSNQKSLEALYSGGSSSAPPPNTTGSATPVNKGLSLAIGMSAKKEITRNLSFLTGIGVHYFSSSRIVGKQMQDSTLLTGDYVPRFYTNSGNEVNKVSSKYFFISLPLMLDWKFIPDKPLHFQAGFSVQQLIGSNAIQYDKENSIYYKDASSLNKTQLFTHLMLGYEFKSRDKSAFVLGPSLQYGLRKLNQKEDKHLFFVGLNAQYFFR